MTKNLLKIMEWMAHTQFCHTHSLVCVGDFSVCETSCEWCGRKYLNGWRTCDHGEGELCCWCVRSTCDYGENDLPEREIVV